MEDCKSVNAYAAAIGKSACSASGCGLDIVAKGSSHLSRCIELVLSVALVWLRRFKKAAQTSCEGIAWLCRAGCWWDGEEEGETAASMLMAALWESKLH